MQKWKVEKERLELPWRRSGSGGGTRVAGNQIRGMRVNAKLAVPRKQEEVRVTVANICVGSATAWLGGDVG